jgi:hypothetical protein
VRLSRSVLLAGLLALAALLARPVIEGTGVLVALFREAWPDHGAAYIQLENARPEELWLVSLKFEGEERVRARPDGGQGWRIRRATEASGPWETGGDLLSALAGERMAVVTYEIGEERVRASVTVPFLLEPLTRCRVHVTFRPDGVQMTPCLERVPAADGGMWRH